MGFRGNAAVRPGGRGERPWLRTGTTLIGLVQIPKGRRTLGMCQLLRAG